MNAVQRGTDRLVKDLKRVVGDSEDLLRATGDVVGLRAEKARERLGEALESAKCSCKVLQGKTSEMAKAADAALRNHPYQVLGVALVLGIAGGILFARKQPCV